MKKRVISVLLVGVLTALIYQQSAMEMPTIAAAMGPEAGAYAGEEAGGEESASDIEPSTDSLEESQEGTQEPQAETVDSQEGIQEPEEGTVDPQERTQEPQAETVESQEGTQEPETGTVESQVGTQEPEEGTVEPQEGTQEPEAGTMDSGTAPQESQEEASEEEISQEENATANAEESEYANLAIAQVNHYVNVRKEPNTDSEILGKIYNGAVAQILDVAGEDQDWFHVVSGSVEGYIKSEYFLYGDAAVEAVDSYVTRYATVIANRLNVRQEPGTDSKRIGYISHGEKVKLLEQQGDWLLIQYTEDKTGYVAAEYVTVSEEFIYAKSIEEERAEQAAQREMAQRMAAQEQAAPENTVVTPLTPPATLYTSNEELRRSIVDYAMLYLGYPYVHGGRSLAGGTDCSGFTCYIYADFGYSISRTPSGQYSSDGRSIDYSEIQPGDIICYGKSKCTHVGMYIGDGQIIHAANSRKGVVIYDADYDNILAVKNIID